MVKLCGGGGGEARLRATLTETKHSEMATLLLVNAVKIRYFVGKRTALGSTGWAQFVCKTLFAMFKITVLIQCIRT